VKGSSKTERALKSVLGMQNKIGGIMRIINFTFTDSGTRTLNDTFYNSLEYSQVEEAVVKHKINLRYVRETTEEFDTFFEKNGGVNQKTVDLFFKTFGVFVCDVVLMGGTQLIHFEEE
jgi:hypothetical protein